MKRPLHAVIAGAPLLLDDEAMQAFIRNGFHVIEPHAMRLPPSFHTAIADKLSLQFADKETRGEVRASLNDALLQKLPELRELFSDPAVDGALTSILGRDWSLHSHSYVHDRFPTEAVQREMIHKDGGFAGCYDGLVTRSRWALLLYYPQAVADDFGPTEVVPGKHYLFENPLPDPGIRATPLTSSTPGTLVVTSYELWHRATFNRVTANPDRARFMLKFMAGRLSEPAADDPSWNNASTQWTSDGPLREAHTTSWEWHLGRDAAVCKLGEDEVAALCRSLDAADEEERLSAALALGRAGQFDALVANLKAKAAKCRRRFLAAADSWKEGDDPPAWPANFYGRRWLEGSAFVGLAAGGAGGAAAAARLLDRSEEWWVRAAAAQALAEMGGMHAAVAAPQLREALRDPDEWVGLAAAEALGCVAPSADGANEEALARALLQPVERQPRWPVQGLRGKWAVVALAKLAGQPGYRNLPAETRETVERALASIAENNTAGGEVLKSGPAWWAQLGLKRASGASQTSPGSWF
ncbi:hypothetical protein AB1Y20_019213 [Prymnesium parvum]|uniref:Uncharacterized protein n=1 Tax=Prymnesium parvum TaxID=97485 RepID=A0AB34JU03_PRYPA